jgi:hypothetical protein
MAALGKPTDMSPVSPTAGHLASSLPDHPLYNADGTVDVVVDVLGWYP